MQPAHNFSGYSTMDLTACPVHCVPDPESTTGGRKIVAYVPKKWTALGPKRDVPTANGRTMAATAYSIDEWEEVLLALVPAPIRADPS